jgi:hypothetical protein
MRRGQQDGGLAYTQQGQLNWQKNIKEDLSHTMEITVVLPNQDELTFWPGAKTPMIERKKHGRQQ